MTRDERERLLLDLLPFIRREARILSRRLSFNEDDLYQEGSIAAWLLLEHFDESLGFKAWTFIRPRVVGSMQDYIRRRRSIFARCRQYVDVTSLATRVPGATQLADTICDYRRSRATDVSESESFEDLMKHCTPKERVLLRRIYVGGEEKKEIAAEQGRAPSVVGYHVRRALNAIQQHVPKGN